MPGHGEFVGSIDHPMLKDSLLPLAASRMAACASTASLSLSASSPDEINAAITKLISDITSGPLHLTQ